MTSLNGTSPQGITSEMRETLLWVDPRDQQQVKKLAKALGIPWVEIRREATKLQRKQRRNGGQEIKDTPPIFVKRFFAQHSIGNFAVS